MHKFAPVPRPLSLCPAPHYALHLFPLNPKPFIFLAAGLFAVSAPAQRSYAPASVLAAGNSYQVSVSGAGVYRVTAAFLAQAGVNTASLPSQSIRLYGNGGQMLPEGNAAVPPDDLVENAIEMFDGGDGIFNGNDYFLFYAPGPDKWVKDSVNKRFTHEKNLYSEKSFYYIQTGGTGKRIAAAAPIPPANTIVNSYNARFFYEKNLVNLLSGGKEWLGEEFSAQQPTRSFDVTFNAPEFSSLFYISAGLVSRSAGSGGSFAVQVNNQPPQQVAFPPVSGNPLDPFAQTGQTGFLFTVTQPQQTIKFSYTPGSINAQGWLNGFEINGRCRLDLSGQPQLQFRDWNSVAPGNRVKFQLQTATANTRVWEVTSPHHPLRQNVQLNGSVSEFENDASSLKEYIAFDGTFFLQPEFVKTIIPQNLHAQGAADMLIITHQNFLSEAQRLAQHHITYGQLTVHTVTAEQVFHEFSSGTADPSAIRNYIKMFYDRYRNSAKPLRFVLLFGDASFDYLQRVTPNTSYVPCWQSSHFTDPLQTLVSDDFFGFLDDQENINDPAQMNLLDVALGRVPVTRAAEAKSYVDKVIAYTAASALGNWRNNITLVADDEDGNLHLNDAEALSQTLEIRAPAFTREKIYLDAYRQESGTGGSRYPLVNAAINAGIFSGTLIWNYSGHGGYNRLADEAILDAGMVASWNNGTKLPLFITATCDFAPYDNPLQLSLGEQVLLKPGAGAIALLATTRTVFSNSNRILVNSFLENAFLRDVSGNYPALGTAVMKAKNTTYAAGGDINNNRKFTLLGDPAITLAFPRQQVITTKVNGLAYTPSADTIAPAKTMIVEGEIRNGQNQLLTGFNGTVYPTVYDQPRNTSTLANDAGSVATTFKDHGNVLFKGRATVTNGKFSFRFIAPRDMQYAPGTGSISYYAENGSTDAQGVSPMGAGGPATTGITDTEGPEIGIWLNDENFVNEGVANLSPLLLVRLSDSSGINTSGWGVGHEITAVLDGQGSSALVLNPYFESELDNFRSGRIRLPLGNLAEGRHSITIKAWDVYNNPSEKTLFFNIAEGGTLTVKRVLNYPNPFTTHTSFWFEHNRPGEDLRVRITVMTMTGKTVKTIVKTINTTGNRSFDIEWDGLDEYGARLGRGIYLYRFLVQTADGQKVLATEKLTIL